MPDLGISRDREQADGMNQLVIDGRLERVQLVGGQHGIERMTRDGAQPRPRRQQQGGKSDQNPTKRPWHDRILMAFANRLIDALDERSRLVADVPAVVDQVGERLRRIGLPVDEPESRLRQQVGK